MALSALDIKKKEFEQKMRGYDVEEVRRFLDDVAKEFELLIRDEISLEDELEETKKKLAHYQSLESTLEKTLLAAQQTVMRMEEHAKKEAGLILGEARLERDKMLRDIPMEIERAKGEAMRLKAEYESTITRMKSVIDGFKKFVDVLGEGDR